MTQGKLVECYSLAKDIERQREDITHIRSEMERSTVIISGSRGGGSADRLCELVAVLDEKVRALADDRRRYRDLVAEVKGWAQDFSPRQREVIRFRYIEALPWHTVATLSGCSERTAYGVYEQIVKNLPEA